MIKLKTEVLRDMLNKAVKVCTFNKMLPLTGLVEIESNEKGLSVKTTDNITTMIITEKIEGLEPARVTVDANVIVALVNKITTEYIELIISESALTITGNGVYNLEIRVDESGEVVKLPAIDQELINSAVREFDFKGIADRLKICRASIAEGEDGKELGNYYMKDVIAACDGQKLSTISNVPSMVNEELFISNDFGKIVMELGFAKANYSIHQDKLVVVGENFALSTRMDIETMNNFKEVTLEGIRGLVNTTYNNKVTIRKSDLANLLDRVGLFVTEYDSKSIDLVFLPDKIKVTNKKKTCDEVIAYETKEITNLVEFTAYLHIEYLKQLLAVLPSETVEFQFDSQVLSIKIVDGDIIQFLSIMEEE